MNNVEAEIISGEKMQTQEGQDLYQYVILSDKPMALGRCVLNQ